MSLEDTKQASGGRQSTAKIFISYSRRDLEFADRVDAALKARGFDTLIDRSEIYALEDWWKRIEALIAQADTIVFILSPDAVGSDVCQSEVRFAASLNKRLAPIVYRRVDDTAVPAELARLNFVFFDDPEVFDESLDRLAEALETDIDWVRKHTEFGEHARRWMIAGRPGPRGLLLRPPALDEAERWIASRPHDAPMPTEAAQAFIAASRRAHTRRRNIVSTSLAIGLVLALGLAGFALWQRQIAAEQRAIAAQQRDTVLLQQSQFLAGLSRRQIENEHDAATGLLLALEGLPDATSDDSITKGRPYWPGAEVSLEAARRALREIAVLSGHTAQVTSVAMTADGAKIVTGSVDGTVRIWDAATGRVLHVLSSDGEPVRSVAVTPDGRRIVAGVGIYGAQHHGSARVWNAENGEELLVLGKQDFAVIGAAITADGDRIVTANVKLVTLWDAKTGTELRRFETGSSGGVQGVAMTPDGRLIVACLSSGEPRVWDADTGAEVITLEGHTGSVLSVAITSDGRRVVTGSKTVGQDDNTARVWDVATGAQLTVLKGHAGAVTSVAITPDGKRVVTGSVDRTARLWDAETGRELLVLGGHAETIWGVALSPDASRVVTAAGTQEFQTTAGMGDDTARIWDAKVEQGLPLQVYNVSAVAVAPDGTRVVVGRGEVQTPDAATNAYVTSGDATVLDARTGAALFTLKGHSRLVTAVAVDPDSTRVATGSDDRSARVWNMLDGSELLRLVGHTDTVTGVTFTPDGTRVVTASNDHTARVWDATSGVELLVFKGHTDDVTSVAVLPEGKRVVTGAVDKTARVWDIATGAELLVLRGHTAAVTSVAVMPDGKRIVTGSEDRTARIWDAATGNELLVLKGHEGEVLDLAVTPDGLRIITAGDDHTVRIWDASTGLPQAVLKFLGEEVMLYGVAAMPGGQAIAVAVDERGDMLMRTNYHSTRILQLFASGQTLIDEAKQIVPRCLLAGERQAYNLPVTPPDWCTRKQKWPYRTGHPRSEAD
jgi:WD40 repeat protein